MDKSGDVRLRPIQVRIALMVITLAVLLQGSDAMARFLSSSQQVRLAISYSEIQFLSSVTSITTCLALIPIGLLIDRTGIRCIPSIIMCLLALCFCASFIFQRLDVEALLALSKGLATALIMPVLLKALSEWYPAHRRGRMLWIYLISATVALVFVTPLAFLINDYYSLRQLTILFVLLALLCTVFILLFMRDRKNVALTSEQELSLDAGTLRDAHASGIFRAFLRMLGHSSTWGIFFAAVAFGLISQTRASWMPAVLEDALQFYDIPYGMVLTRNIVAFGGLLGWIAGGVVSDRMSKRSKPLSFRRDVVVVALGMAALLWIAACYIPNLIAFVAVAAVAQFFTNLAQISLLLLVVTIIPSRYCATLAGFQAAAAMFASICAAWILESLGDEFSESDVMVAAAILTLGAAVIVSRLVRKPVLGTETRGVDAVFA